MRVYLIRHPHPAVPPGVCYGATDVDLADDPLECATRLRAALPADLPLFSSPLRRCRQLAQVLHPAPRYDERLREIDFGSWELRSWKEIPRAQIDAWAESPLTYAPPGGESVAALRVRVAAFLAERGGEDFAVVSHAGVMRILAALLQGLPEDRWLNLRFGYGELTLLQLGSVREC